MKKYLFLMMSAIVVFTVGACSDNDDSPEEPGETKVCTLEATSATSWTYFSLKEGKVVGSGEENEEDNAAWFARTDWDVAMSRYKIRTNSGTSTTAGGKGGVFIMPDSYSFTSVRNVPDKVNGKDENGKDTEISVAFAADRNIEWEGMGGAVNHTNMSDATVILFQLDAEGNKVMPPVYLKAPVCLFRSADSKHYYKVEFVQYLNENKEQGYIKFNTAEIYK